MLRDPGCATGVGMPILRRRATTAQPTGSGAVPGQRDTQEGTTYPESAESSRGGGRGATGMGQAVQRAEYGQAEGRRAGTQEYGGSAESRIGAQRRHYGMPGTLMTLSGLLTFFIGITGIIKGIFFNRVATYPFYFSVRGRGVTLLVIGAVAFAVGLALLIRMHWARHVATVVAVVSAVANFMFLPFYPFWSIIVLTLNVLVIWELTRERRESAHFLPRHMSRTAYSRVRGVRDRPMRIRAAPRRRSRHSAALGRRCPSGAVASSTGTISSALSARNDRG